MYDAEFRNLVLATYQRMFDEEFYRTAESLLAVLNDDIERESFGAELDARAESREPRAESRES